MRMLRHAIKAMLRGGKPAGETAGDSTREAARDALLARMPRGSICAEIGVYKGSFSAKVLEIVRPSRLHLIDPWKYEPAAAYGEAWYGGEKGGNQENMDAIYQSVLRRFGPWIQSGTVQVHRAASSDAAAVLPDNYFDWIYVDGNHRYEFVKNDLEAYCSKVKAGGYIAGDDYGEGGWWEGGVKRAVDEFAATAPAELLWVDHGQFCLKKTGFANAAETGKTA